MLSVMEDRNRPDFAHPMFWAPFVVVGEGGSDLPLRGTNKRRARSVTAVSPTEIYETLKNANVRAEPSTGAMRTMTLRKGTRVQVLEVVRGGDWYRIGRNGKSFGFVYGPLLRNVP